MRPEQFVYWLQGFFELTDSKDLTSAQVAMIKEHLKLVFDKQTPSIEDLIKQRPRQLPIWPDYPEWPNTTGAPIVNPSTIVC